MHYEWCTFGTGLITLCSWYKILNVWRVFSWNFLFSISYTIEIINYWQLSRSTNIQLLVFQFFFPIYQRQWRHIKQEQFFNSICRGGSSFFPRGGGGGLTQRRCGTDFFLAIFNPRKWCFPGIYSITAWWRFSMHRRCPSRVAASRFFFVILNPRKWCFPGIY